MYSRPNSSDRRRVHGGKGLAVLAALIVLAFLYSLKDGDPKPPTPAGAFPQRATAKAKAAQPAPARNPLERMLRPPENVTPKEGIGVALLVDVSGSMDAQVADASGGRARKIDIARRSALNVLTQCSDFAAGHADRTVRVGVYEFSDRGDNRGFCRVVVPIGPMDLDAARKAVQNMHPAGGTPIGDAILAAKKDLDASGLTRLHILVVTDGENNRGYDPADVVNAISLLPAQHRASVYCIAFDVATSRFARLRDAGGLVLAAANEKELQQTLDYVLAGKILAEQPETPGTKP